MIFGGFWWFLVVFGGFWWFSVIFGGFWWFLVVFGGFWWFSVGDRHGLPGCAPTVPIQARHVCPSHFTHYIVDGRHYIVRDGCDGCDGLHGRQVVIIITNKEGTFAALI